MMNHQGPQPVTRRRKMLTRSICFALVLSLGLALSHRSQAQTRPAPLYSLPKLGTWVEYEWKATRQVGKEETGTLRISFVGQQKVRGSSHVWIEIKKESGEKGRTRRQVRKLLVAEKAFADGQAFHDHIAAAYEQADASGPVTRLSNDRMEKFLGLYLDEGKAALKTQREKEKIKVPLGEYVTRRVSAEGKTEGRLLEYVGWLTDRVPFGWARFEIHEKAESGPSRTIFTASAVRSGKKAISEVDQTKSRSEK
jgi:hypothetical protein